MRCSACAPSGSGPVALSLRHNTGVARSCSASQLNFAQSSGCASSAANRRVVLFAAGGEQKQLRFGRQ